MSGGLDSHGTLEEFSGRGRLGARPTPSKLGTTCSKKKDKSVVRKEGNLYVLDLFVKVAAVAPALIKYKPIEVDTITQVADGRGRRKRGTLDCSKPFF